MLTNELTTEQKESILQKRKISYIRVLKASYYKDRSDYFNIRTEEAVAYCYCKENNGNELKFDHTHYCKFCGNQIYYNKIYPKNFVSEFNEKMDELKVNKYRIPACKYKEILDTFFYVRKHPEKENSILIHKISVELVAGQTFEDNYDLNIKILHTIEIIPNEGCRAFKISRNKEVLIDIFTAFQLSSKLLKDGVDVEYEDSYSLIPFVLKNDKFAQYTGFLECFNQVDINLQRNAFFFFYMYIYAQFPVVEFIVKMGYIKLISDIIRDLSLGYNKDVIRNRAQTLSKILNNESTKGSMALTIPKYIADDLNYKESNLDTYIFWGDIYQLENLSKENYEKINNSDIYYSIKSNRTLDSIPNIMKHGYSFQNIINYIEKQYNLLSTPKHLALQDNYRSNTYEIGHLINLLKDYLNMCDLMNIIPDKYPKDIKIAHDNCSKAYKIQEDLLNDKSILLLAEEALKNIPKTKEYIESEYTIVLPKSSRDIIQEGQMQHNCVGSYIRNVLKKECIIFFIRKKDDLNQSYVTAEFRSNKLYQIFYKNNQRVSDSTILNIANSFCKNLSKALII